MHVCRLDISGLMEVFNRLVQVNGQNLLSTGLLQMFQQVATNLQMTNCDKAATCHLQTCYNLINLGRSPV